jgi:hypothetical protein
LLGDMADKTFDDESVTAGRFCSKKYKLSPPNLL